MKREDLIAIRSFLSFVNMVDRWRMTATEEKESLRLIRAINQELRKGARNV